MMKVIGALILHFSKFPLMCERRASLGIVKIDESLKNNVQTFDNAPIENENSN